MGSFSIWHWLIVLVIVMLVFGTKKLRNVGSDLGGAVKGFKDGMKDAGADKSSEKSAEPQQVTGQTIESLRPIPSAAMATTSASGRRTTFTNGPAAMDHSVAPGRGGGAT